jgi:peptidyl-dipeptidase Dcp
MAFTFNPTTTAIRLAVAFTLTGWIPASVSAAPMSDNPLLAESSLPYHFPPFDRVRDEHYLPAFEAGMAEQLREIEGIADNPAEPDLENTIVAMERSGQTLARARRVFANLNGTHTNPQMQEVEKTMAPRFSAHSDAIRLNAALFKRLQALHDKKETLGLDAESKRLLERYYLDFVRAGAKLSETEKTRLKSLNSEIASLQTTFSQNVLKEVNASGVLVETREELAGLSENAIAAAASAAKAAGQDGKFLIILMNTSGQPPLKSLENRALRERIHEASLNRNSKGGEFDNRPVVARIARLRAERAALLGYDNHATYELEEQTAKSIEAVNKLLGQLAPLAVANAREEASALQAMIDSEKGGFQLQPWDWALYSEKTRKDRYAFDESQIRPYLEMNRVLIDGVFYAATKLYGITFKERTDLPLYHPDTRLFEVFNEDGSPLAMFIVDWYARPSKRGGAWANAYVPQSGLLARKPVIANHLNIPKPPDGEPTLMTWDEVITAFHEFGHAVHGMFSDVKYPRFSGTSVPRDFVEYPSQVNEMWADWPEVLRNYARHHKTGEPLPRELLEKIQAAAKFNQGFATTEYLAAALLDQTWHQISAKNAPPAEEVMAFERAALKSAGMDFQPVPPRYRTTYFSHVFSSGYSAGYYSYIWSEVLDADSVEWFKENGGLKRVNGDRYRKLLLSRGGSIDAMEMFRAFRGRDPEIAPLLERRGLNARPADTGGAGAN